MSLLGDPFSRPPNPNGQIPPAILAQNVRTCIVDGYIAALEAGCSVSGFGALPTTSAAVSGFNGDGQTARGGVVDQALVGGLLDVGFFGHVISDVAEQCAMFRGQIRNLPRRFWHFFLEFSQIVGGLFFRVETFQSVIVRSNYCVQVCCAIEFNCPVHLRSPVKFFNERADYCAFFFRDKFNCFIEVCQNLVAGKRLNIVEQTVYAGLSDNVCACGDAAGGVDVGFKDFFMFHDVAPIRIPGSAGAVGLRCAVHELNYTHETKTRNMYFPDN